MSITIKKLLDEGAEKLSLSVSVGQKYLGHSIRETAMNRPGLALAGFFRYFARHRLQIFGWAELNYLKSLPREEQAERLEELFRRHIPGVVITRNRKVPEGILNLAERFKVPVLRTTMITMDFVNECTILLGKLKAPHTRVQGTCMEVMGIGLLLRGDPGIGKSETALSLIERGYSLVSDDVTEMRSTSRGRVVCWPSDVTRYHMDIRGLGVIHVPALFGVAAIRKHTELDLVIDLKRPNGEEEQIDACPNNVQFMDVNIPAITLPVRSGRDMANIVEVAALNQKLKGLGCNAKKEFDNEIIKRLSKKAGLP